jgi:excinuclease ABC subunit B
MDNFKLQAKFKPTGDQPKAIEQLLVNLKNKKRYQTLLGVTGSGKTFTAANVIAKINKPTLVIAHNKTLAAQLADEFREFFPENAVRYFVSYYDYYQPEAYMPTSDTYIEKDSSINDEIAMLRHAATQSLLTRKDVIIVASVSCIYGLGSPDVYLQSTEKIAVGEKIAINTLAEKLVKLQYERSDYEFSRGKFRIKGDTVEVYPSYENVSLRVEFFGDQIDKIYYVDPISGRRAKEYKEMEIFPAKHFLTVMDQHSKAVTEIKKELDLRLKDFEKDGKLVEAYRLKQKTEYDLEMIRELGYVNGIENYSRYFDNRKAGQPPYCLIDYFPKDFLTIIDESHMTIPQIRGMYAGDQARKGTLIEHGFRLPSALDNRPLKFDEFSGKIGQTIFMSATPAPYELDLSIKSCQTSSLGRHCEESSTRQSLADASTSDKLRDPSSPQDDTTNNCVVEQLIRPTGLIDPEIMVRPTKNQIDDLINEIKTRTAKNERILVTTLTKKMAEALTEFFIDAGIKVQYLHSDIETIERTEILAKLRNGEIDVLVGINLLREGLDLPEVSLVAILDADKEGFLRSEVALIQTIGRAARHINGKVIMYGDKITDSMRKAIFETNRRRKRQLKYNEVNNITPVSTVRAINQLERTAEEETIEEIPKTKKAIQDLIRKLRREMIEASATLNFETAARLRDEIVELEDHLK